MKTRQIKTFDWTISEPRTSSWELIGGYVGLANSSLQVYLVTPVKGSHVPPPCHGTIYMAEVEPAWANTFRMGEADSLFYQVAARTRELEQFADPRGNGINWLRMDSLHRHLPITPYTTHYVRQWEEWCKGNPRCAWALAQMPAGSKLRNEYIKQVIGMTRKPPISLPTLQQDLWRYADQVELRLRKELDAKIAYCQQDAGVAYSMLEIEQQAQAASDHHAQGQEAKLFEMLDRLL